MIDELLISILTKRRRKREAKQKETDEINTRAAEAQLAYIKTQRMLSAILDEFGGVTMTRVAFESAELEYPIKVAYSGNTVTISKVIKH